MTSPVRGPPQAATRRDVGRERRMWGFGRISNHSGEWVMVDYAIPDHDEIAGDELNGRSREVLLAVGARGVIAFTDRGPQPDGPRPRAVDIRFADQHRRWWYSPPARLDVALQADGAFELRGERQTIRGWLPDPLAAPRHVREHAAAVGPRPRGEGSPAVQHWRCATARGLRLP